MKYLFYQSNHWSFSGFWLKESLNIKETRLSGDFEPIVGNCPDKTSLENSLYCFESIQINRRLTFIVAKRKHQERFLRDV